MHISRWCEVLLCTIQHLTFCVLEAEREGAGGRGESARNQNTKMPIPSAQSRCRDRNFKNKQTKHQGCSRVMTRPPAGGSGRACGFHYTSRLAVDERLRRSRTQESNAIELHGGKAAVGLDPDCTELVNRRHATRNETAPVLDYQ